MRHAGSIRRRPLRFIGVGSVFGFRAFLIGSARKNLALLEGHRDETLEPRQDFAEACCASHCRVPLSGNLFSKLRIEFPQLY